MTGDKVRPINLNLTEEIIAAANRAITGGRYSSVSAYVRALIVRERRLSGDRRVMRANPDIRMGRPSAK